MSAEACYKILRPNGSDILIVVFSFLFAKPTLRSVQVLEVQLRYRWHLYNKAKHKTQQSQVTTSAKFK